MAHLIYLSISFAKFGLFPNFTTESRLLNHMSSGERSRVVGGRKNCKFPTFDSISTSDIMKSDVLKTRSMSISQLVLWRLNILVSLCLFRVHY